MTARSDERKSAAFHGVEALLSFLEACHALDRHSKRAFQKYLRIFSMLWYRIGHG